MTKVVALGELMLRLSPDGYLRMMQAERLNVTFGGGEANAAVSLANYGYDAVFVTKLPEHDIGQMAVNTLRRYGVNTSLIRRGGERMGIYFVEKGASQRGSRIIYDRKGSAIALAQPEEFDWDCIFQGAVWFHITGIMPALSESAAQICLEACQKAKHLGVTVSCDINYRKKLWSKAEAGSTMRAIMPYVDVCIANEEDAADVFGICSPGTDVENGHVNVDGYEAVAKQLCEQFNCKAAAITLRRSITANDNEWQAMLLIDGKSYYSKRYPVHIVDRVGSGDSFAAGLIHGMISGITPERIIEFAAAASCLKHTIEGDFNLVSEGEVISLIEGNGSGRVQR